MKNNDLLKIIFAKYLFYFIKKIENVFFYGKKFTCDFSHPKIKSTWIDSFGGFFWIRFFEKKSLDFPEKGKLFL